MVTRNYILEFWSRSRSTLHFVNREWIRFSVQVISRTGMESISLFTKYFEDYILNEWQALCYKTGNLTDDISICFIKPWRSSTYCCSVRWWRAASSASWCRFVPDFNPSLETWSRTFCILSCCSWMVSLMWLILRCCVWRRNLPVQLRGCQPKYLSSCHLPHRHRYQLFQVGDSKGLSLPSLRARLISSHGWIGRSKTCTYVLTGELHSLKGACSAINIVVAHHVCQCVKI